MGSKVYFSQFLSWLWPGSTPGEMSIPISLAHGSQIISNFRFVLLRVFASFSWAMIQEIFLIAALVESVGCFQALASVILAPKNIK